MKEATQTKLTLWARDSFIRRSIRNLRTGWRIPLAHLKRKLVTPEIIVGITGSVGKSTTTRILVEIIGRQHVVHTTKGINTPKGIKNRFWQNSKRPQAWVQEISGHSQVDIEKSLDFVEPKIGIVTKIGLDHVSELRSLEAIKENKEKLINCLPKDGCAILNLDDDLVAQMATNAPSNVITFGKAPDADVRLAGVGYDASNHMELTVEIDGKKHVFSTQFVGSRWCASLLGAIAAAHHLDIDMATIKDAVSSVGPELYKDSVHRANGVTYVLDCYKSAAWTVPSSCEIVEKMNAKRKFLLIGTLSDYKGSARKAYSEAVRSAMEVADFVVTYGYHARRARRIFDNYPGRILAFERFADLQAHLNVTLVDGDLIYIKAGDIDHLARLWHAHEKPLACYVDDCRRQFACNTCKHLHGYEKGLWRRFIGKLAQTKS